MTIKANPALVDWRTKVFKRRNDSLTREVIYPVFFMDRKPKVLTLPAADWLWEKSLLETFPSGGVFTGVERDPVVFAKMEKEGARLDRLYKKSTFRSVPGNINDALKRCPKQDVIYMDWMGTWSEEKRETLETLVSLGRLQKEGFLLITLSLVRGHVSTEELEAYIRGDYEFLFMDQNPREQNVNGGTKTKTLGIAGWIISLAETFGQEFKPMFSKIYYNISANSSPKPEVLMCFQRTK